MAGLSTHVFAKCGVLVGCGTWYKIKCNLWCVVHMRLTEATRFAKRLEAHCTVVAVVITNNRPIQAADVPGGLVVGPGAY